MQIHYSLPVGISRALPPHGHTVPMEEAGDRAAGDAVVLGQFLRCRAILVCRDDGRHRGSVEALAELEGLVSLGKGP